MKKIFKFIGLVILTHIVFNVTCFAQLPLQFGDAVITHSPDTYTASGPSTSPAVLRVVHTSNTATAPLGSTWTVPPKPANDFYANWNVDTLGFVFGISLDQNTNPNIYLSSTQIYTNSTLNKRKVWRINGATGSHSLIYDFNNPSGTGTATSTRSLGNLKYLNVGGVENMYVSDWENGDIKRLTGNSASASLWANQNPWTPQFGKQKKDTTEMPYGLAVRKMPSGSYKLYYAKISTNNNGPSIGGYGNNEIWSVDLNPVGDFIAGTETQALIPNINRPVSSWGGYAGSGISYNCSILPVIADIAFTNDGSKMLVGQQSWGTFGFLAPHNSEVQEFRNTPSLSSTWVASGNIFPSGQSLGASCLSAGGPVNAVGGVSYSNNILKRDNQSFGCDTSVWFTADYINVFTGSNTVYGLQGMNANGGTISNSIWIDADDNLNYFDKTFLGDVEVYKTLMACTSCGCGKFDSIMLGNTLFWKDPQPLPNLSYTAPGTASGVLFAFYTCNSSDSSCLATYNWQVTSLDGIPVTPGIGSTTNSFDLGMLNSLPCGTYQLSITPFCGGKPCDPIRITIKIDCKPSCGPCKSEIIITPKGNPFVVPQNNTSTANPVSTVTSSFTLTATPTTTPITEVRVLIDEFRITPSVGNDNCMLCRNKPQTWANINSGTLTGVATVSTANPSTLESDIRELVFNNGTGTFFTLNGNVLKITLGVPGVTGLSCCTLKGEVCLKFIIRDANCCEREVMKCFTFTIK